MTQLRKRDAGVLVRGRSFLTVQGGLPALIAILLSIAPVAQAGNILNLKTSVQVGTCEFILPPEVLMGYVLPDDFASHNGTASVRHFNVQLTNCTGPQGGTAIPGIVLSGNTLPGSNDEIFSDTPSLNAGFMFREGSYIGDLSGFKTPTEMIRKGEPTWQSRFQPGEIPHDGTTLAYTAGFVSGGTGTPSLGDVKAAVSFKVVYR